ncbi:MAG: tetratricopeptide repeat protein [Cyanobacteriota bacterium]
MPLHEVITFYSYKGGTGRTMALANVACLFATRKEDPQRVLAIDWDLEAPGLPYYLRPPRDEVDTSMGQGVVDFFTRVQELLDAGPGSGEDEEKQAEAILARIPLGEFCQATSVPNVDLMPAGRMDASYQARLARLDWPHMYQQAPGLFRCFARQLAQAYDVVLVDSRTVMTDSSGICTSLLPDKLVVVFTANRQSLAGIEPLVQSSVAYRQGSRDVRPLLVYPLPSRIDAERDKLRQLWRHGDSALGVEGYQPQFQRMFQTAYALDACDLSAYCDEVQVQHSPDYAYGEDVAAIHMQDADRFSIVRSYQALMRWIQASAAPWETPESAEARQRLSALLAEEEELNKDPAAADWLRLARLQEESLALAKEQRGPLHQETTAIRARLITTLLRGGDTERVCQLLLELAEALQFLRMPVRVHAVGTMLGAVGSLRAKPELEGTAERLRQAAIASLTPAGETPDANSLSVLETLATTLREHAALPEARALQEALVAMQESARGGENPATLSAMAHLASTRQEDGDLPGARELLERVVETSRRVLGDEHPDTLTAMAHLASTLGTQGDLARARTLEKRVLEASGRVLGEDHPETLTAIANLAETLRAQGELAGARALLERVLEVRRRVLGADAPDTLTAMNALAATMGALGEFVGERALRERVLELRRRVLGEDAPDTLSAMDDLAVTLRKVGDLSSARILEGRALEARTRLLGEDHPDTLAAMTNLAGTLLRSGALEEANALQQRILEIQQRLLKTTEPRPLKSASDPASGRDAGSKRREP